jgi:hypothetical protein
MNLLGFPASDDEIDRFLALEADPVAPASNGQLWRFETLPSRS